MQVRCSKNYSHRVYTPIALFCPECGARTEKVDFQEMETCPHCHCRYSAESKYCPYCGKQLEER